MQALFLNLFNKYKYFTDAFHGIIWKCFMVSNVFLLFLFIAIMITGIDFS